MHDLFLEDYASAFPAASLWVPPDSNRYFSRLTRANSLSDQPPWQNEVTHILMHGVPRLNECVFFHSASESLICADLFFNIPRESPFLTRISARFGGFYQKLAIPLDIRWLMVRDPKALTRSLERLKALPFRNLIIAHGDNLFHDAASAVAQATSKLQLR